MCPSSAVDAVPPPVPSTGAVVGVAATRLAPKAMPAPHAPKAGATAVMAAAGPTLTPTPHPGPLVKGAAMPHPGRKAAPPAKAGAVAIGAVVVARPAKALISCLGH